MTTRVAIFTRVSKMTGDYQRQISELTKYSIEMNYEIVETISEKISGGRKNEERAGIVRLMELVNSKNIDKVLIWELSRLGRNSFEVAKIINELNENKISLYIKNYNLETLYDDGSINPMAKFMVAILVEFADNERLYISQRLASGYDQFRRSGGVVGRKTGSVEDESAFIQKHNDAVKLLKKGMSIRNVAQLTGKSTKTIQKVKHYLEI